MRKRRNPLYFEPSTFDLSQWAKAKARYKKMLSAWFKRTEYAMPSFQWWVSPKVGIFAWSPEKHVGFTFEGGKQMKDHNLNLYFDQGMQLE